LAEEVATLDHIRHGRLVFGVGPIARPISQPVMPGKARYLRVPIYVAETEASARADPEPSIMQFYRTLGLQLEGAAKRPGMGAGEARAELLITLVISFLTTLVVLASKSGARWRDHR
jgi:hypothetical protein